MEDYIEHVKSIVEALSIEKEPVGIKYTDEDPGVELEKRSYGMTLKQFWDGKTPSIEMRGSLCWSMITYPLVSGNFNLSVGDISARRLERWDPNIMVASIPWERIRCVAEAIDLSTAGRAEPSEEFERMTEKMKSRR